MTASGAPKGGEEKGARRGVGEEDGSNPRSTGAEVGRSERSRRERVEVTRGVRGAGIGKSEQGTWRRGAKRERRQAEF